MTLHEHIALRLSCSEGEAAGVLRTRDVLAQLDYEPAFWQGLIALSAHNARAHQHTSFRASTPLEAAEKAGEAREKSMLPKRLAEMVAQADRLELEFAKMEEIKKQQKDEE